MNERTMDFDICKHLTAARILEDVILDMIIEQGPTDCYTAPVNWGNLIRQTGKIGDISQKGSEARVVLSYAGLFCRNEVVIDMPAQEIEIKVRNRMTNES